MSQSNAGNRRSFILTSGAVLAGATVCSGCSIFTSQAKPDVQATAKAGVITLSDTDTAKLKENGSTLRVVSPDGDTRIFVVRGQDGQLTALSMICTHWGSDVNYVADKNHLVCPSHGSLFGLDGSVLEGPAGDPLDRYKVEEGQAGITISLT